MNFLSLLDLKSAGLLVLTGSVLWLSFQNSSLKDELFETKSQLAESVNHLNLLTKELKKQNDALVSVQIEYVEKKKLSDSKISEINNYYKKKLSEVQKPTYVINNQKDCEFVIDKINEGINQ